MLFPGSWIPIAWDTLSTHISFQRALWWKLTLTPLKYTVLRSYSSAPTSELYFLGSLRNGEPLPNSRSAAPLLQVWWSTRPIAWVSKCASWIPWANRALRARCRSSPSRAPGLEAVKKWEELMDETILMFYDLFFSPPVRWGLLDFMWAVLPLLLPLLLFSFSPLRCHLRHHFRQLYVAMGSARPQQGAPDCSSAGPQQGAPDCSGQRRTSPGGLWSGLGSAGPYPGGSGAEWAAPDLASQKICQKICQKYVRQECQKKCQKKCQKICQ